MIVKLTITDAEIRDALRAWMLEHGVPVAALESVRFEAKGPGNKDYFSRCEEVKVEATYECDSLGGEDTAKSLAGG